MSRFEDPAPPSPEYLIDQILPRNEIHLLAGPSGSGKTRWLFDTLLDWQMGHDILGYSSHPVRWVYVSADRDKANVYRTLQQLDIPTEVIPLVPAWEIKKLTMYEIMDQVDQQDARLVVWEAFGSFVEPPGLAPQVRDFMGFMHSWCLRRDHTILGVVESPKMKPLEKYGNPRHRVSGVASWAHLAETVILLENYESKNNKGPNPYRVLNLCPRIADRQEAFYMFDREGHLRPVSRIEDLI